MTREVLSSEPICRAPLHVRLTLTRVSTHIELHGISLASVAIAPDVSNPMKDGAMRGMRQKRNPIDSGYRGLTSEPRAAANASPLAGLGRRLLSTLRHTLRSRAAVAKSATNDVSVRVDIESCSSGMVVLHLRGRLDMEGSPLFRRMLQSIVQQASRGLVLSLAGVECMDSSGLAVLIEGLRWSRQRGANYLLANLTPAARMAIELARLENLLPIVQGDRGAMPEQVAVAS